MNSDLRAQVRRRLASDAYRTWGYHSRVSRSHRYVCVSIPKIACTTVKTVLRRLDGLPDSPQIHDEGARLGDFELDEVVTMITAPEWLRFAFVRNPYARLFSAYKSKIGNTWEHQYGWLQRQIREALDYPVREGVRVGIVTFDDFVRFLAESDDPRVVRDGHLAVQVEVLQQDCIRYDVLGRFESFRGDFELILDRLGAPLTVRAAAAEVLNPTPQLPLAAAYRRELADLAYAIYRSDFDALGYERDSWWYA